MGEKSTPGRATVAVQVLAALTIVAVGVVDFLAGFYLSLSLFYLVPVAVVTWRSGPRAGAFMVALVLVASLGADLSVLAETGGGPTTWMVAWNGLVRASACALVVWLVQMQRRALEREAVLARTDPLTGLANRREFSAALAAELRRCRRYDRPMAIAVLDVDEFKQINDRFGHDTGDVVLAELAARLRERLRHTDMVARLGGDEFAVLLPETGERQARQLMRTLSEPLSVRPDPDDDLELQVRLSLGVAAVTGERCDRSPEQVMAAADQAMYAEKHSRRDSPPTPRLRAM